jgi:regulator of nonsense transcripts 1
VALTRARYGLVVLGNPRVLARHPVWSGLLSHFRGEGALVEGPLANLKQSMVQLARPRAPAPGAGGGPPAGGGAAGLFRPVARAGERHEGSLPRHSGGRAAADALRSYAAPPPGGGGGGGFAAPATQGSMRSQAYGATQESALG